MNDLRDNPDLPRLPVQSPTADLHDYLALKAQAPQVDKLRAALLSHIELTEGTIPRCFGQVVTTACVQTTLEPHWQRTGIRPALVAKKTIIFHLPPEFEPCLASFSERCPQVFNHPDTALRSNTTYQGWTVQLPGEPAPIEVWVDESALDDALNSAFVYREREWGWVPVIALAGASVAICGFEVDEVLLCCTQAASMNARDTVPENVYTDKELDEAALRASKVGLTPWFEGRWTTDSWDGGSVRTVLGATIYHRDDAD